MNVILEKNMVAEAAVLANRIVKFGTADGQVVQAAAAADLLIGVASRDFDAAIGERIDVMTHGIAAVKLGGAVTRGQPVTSDANGKGIAAAPAAGANARVVGIAMASGVLDDVIDVLLSQSVMQG
jgi:hypothetical protein